MKYLIEFWAKEPFAENMKKIYAIEAERTKKGEIFTNHTIYYSLAEMRAIMIVDADPHKIAKWAKDYMAVMSAKISPLIERSEFDKL
jgi:tRNA 2-selenouridine synthase SelU